MSSQAKNGMLALLLEQEDAAFIYSASLGRISRINRTIWEHLALFICVLFLWGLTETRFLHVLVKLEPVDRSVRSKEQAA